MKIAVPLHNGYVSKHFGHTEMYVVLTISLNGEILQKELISAEQGSGCKSGIADILAQNEVNIMLAGNIGASAIDHLNSKGIYVIRGCYGPAEEVVTGYLQGKIKDSHQTCHKHECFVNTNYY